MEITAMDLRNLLNGTTGIPVLYVERDEKRRPLRLVVWDERLVPRGDIVVYKRDLLERVGDSPDDDLLSEVIADLQPALDEITYEGDVMTDYATSTAMAELSEERDKYAI